MYNRLNGILINSLFYNGGSYFIKLINNLNCNFEVGVGFSGGLGLEWGGGGERGVGFVVLLKGGF